ncbi:hypothetical protein M9H77_23638 [Catharanthus roseus]|uniref:Uncharacterized protein n=1 Tax=Catharanthus roseus TaxID=4058 RepID=A0ACC0ATW7_CATRO|nr:hypothetical protein M9H77_23638 [Catharanthus roseus]
MRQIIRGPTTHRLTETTYVTEFSALEDRPSVYAHSLLVLFDHFDIVLDVNSLCLAFNSSSSGWTEDSFEVGVLRSFPLASLERLLPSRFTRDLLEPFPHNGQSCYLSNPKRN